MMQATILDNAQALQQDLDWLQRLIELRLSLYFQLEAAYQHINELPPPDLSKYQGNYAEFVTQHELSMAERMVLILALAPHLRPETLDGFFAKNQTYDRPFSEFGGLRGKAHTGFIPTGETALFLFGGTNLSVRLLIHYLFSGDFLFSQQNVLYLDHAEKDEPRWAGRIMISKEYLDYFTHGDQLKPEFGPDFPARYLETKLNWEDLVLPDDTMAQIEEIRDWLHYGEELLTDYGLQKSLQPGYKCLFYGPPGTGKTLTASLLGKSTARDVYRIDLSLVVSKYVGETEKNLAKVFDMAQNQNWILFFDEADALFGRRSQGNSSNDRYANQEVAYLLQRIEDFPGVVILATNLRDHIDEAFSRRFQNTIYFPLPGEKQRLQLWEQSLPAKMALEERIDLRRIAADYEMSGGLMMNVVRFCALKAVKREPACILHEDLTDGIRRELEKEGKLLL